MAPPPTRTTDAPIAPSPAHSEVSDILRDARLTTVFQPIIALKDGCLVAFEALARIRPLPGDTAALFERAAREHVAHKLDHLAHSLAFAGAPYLAHDALLFVNASPASASRSDFAGRLERLAHVADLDPARIVVEVTELGDAGDDDAIARSITALRETGFGIALDDIGAGHSDLRRILRLRPRWLKLDRTLCQRLESDPYARSLVEALVRFADHNELRVVAEGLELPSHARAAAELGIAYAQGYWFAHPVSLCDAATTLCVQRVQRRWRAAALAA